MYRVYNGGKKFKKFLPDYTGYFIMYEKIYDFDSFFHFGPPSGQISTVSLIILYVKYEQLI